MTAVKLLAQYKRLVILVGVILVLALFGRCGDDELASLTPASSPSESTADSTVGPVPTADDDSVLWVVTNDLDVRDRDRVGYERAKFGQAWKDVDRNGCDTRNDVLRRDLRKRQTKPGTRGCVMLKGMLHVDDVDSYAARKVKFKRGDGEIEIDHTVALADAWRAGAYAWDQDRREKFANDPMNLEAIDSDTNQTKGDKTFNRWQPSDDISACYFAARVVTIKQRYELTVTPDERRSLVATLSTEDCGGDVISPAKKSDFKWPKPKPMGEPKPKPEPEQEDHSSDEPWNRPGPDLDCSDIGHRVEIDGPDYHRLDADGDGVGCDWM